MEIHNNKYLIQIYERYTDLKNSNKIEFKIEVCNTKTTRLKITTSNNNTVSLIAVHLRIN